PAHLDEREPRVLFQPGACEGHEAGWGEGGLLGESDQLLPEGEWTVAGGARACVEAGGGVRSATLLLAGFRSCAPGVRIAPRMKHRENNQLTAAHAIVNAEWKAMHAYPANIRNDFSKSARRRACTKQRALDL